MPKKECYTIGHSTHTFEHFKCLLVRWDINCIVDVRSFPYSKHAPHFNRESIQSFLINNNIKYIFMGKELGARQAERENIDINGKVMFDKVKEKISFIKAIERIIQGIDKGYKIALMCSEKDPLYCHRAILIGNSLSQKGIKVLHIYEDGSLKNQHQLEDELIDYYFPQRNQLTLFNTSYKEYLERALKKREKEIAYQMKTHGKMSRGENWKM